MKASDLMVLAGAAVAVFLLLKTVGKGGTSGASAYWPTVQGNTGYPPEAYTGMPAAGGGVWV